MADNNIYTNNDPIRQKTIDIGKSLGKLKAQLDQFDNIFKQNINKNLMTSTEHLRDFSKTFEKYTNGIEKYTKEWNKLSNRSKRHLMTPDKLNSQREQFYLNYNNASAITPVDKLVSKTQRYEAVQAINDVFSNITSLVSQAAAAAEARYRQDAGTSLQHGNYLDAVNQFKYASNANQIGNALEGFSNAIGGALVGAKTLGPWGALLGGTVGLGSGAYKWYQESKALDNERIKAGFQIIDTGRSALDKFTTTREKESISKELNSLLSDPVKNNEAIKSRYEANQKLLETAKKEEQEIAKQLEVLANRKQHTNEQIQQMADLTKSLAKAAETTDKYSAIQDSLSKGLTEAEKLIKEENKRKEELAKKEKEAIDSYSKTYSLMEENTKYAEVRRQYKILKDASLNVYGDIEHIKYLDAGMKNIIDEQQITKDNIERQIWDLQDKVKDGSITSDEYKTLIELTDRFNQLTEAIRNDKAEIHSNINELAKLSKEKEEYTKQFDISNSKFLASDLGSFNRYFGKTNPDTKLLGETNRILTKILDSINNQIFNTQVATFQ